MFKNLKNLFFIICRGGTNGFNDAELALLGYASEALPIEEKQIFELQISSAYLVQRPHKGRISVAYYKHAEQVQQLPYIDYEYCIAKVSYRKNGKRKTTSIVLHDGRLMTLEHNVPVSSKEIDYMEEVVLHPSGFKSVTTEIDSEEHGAS